MRFCEIVVDEVDMADSIQMSLGSPAFPDAHRLSDAQDLDDNAPTKAHPF